MSLRHRIPLLALTLAVALPAAAEWTLLRKNDDASLSIDPKSIKRQGDESSFRYLVEFPIPQGNPNDGVVYKALIVNASVRCKPRTISIGKTAAYADEGAKGRVLRTSMPKFKAFQPVESGTSDEDLWKRVCEDQPAAEKPKAKQ